MMKMKNKGKGMPPQLVIALGGEPDEMPGSAADEAMEVEPEAYDMVAEELFEAISKKDAKAFWPALKAAVSMCDCYDADDEDEDDGDYEM